MILVFVSPSNTVGSSKPGMVQIFYLFYKVKAATNNYFYLLVSQKMEKEIQLKFPGAQRYILKSFVLSDQLSKTQSY